MTHLLPRLLGRLLLITFSIFLFNNCIAQKKRLDSLLQVDAAHPREDTFKLRVLNLIIDCYAHIDPDKGLALGNKAIALANKLNSYKGLSVAYRCIAVCYWGKGEFKEALKMDMRAQEICIQKKDKDGIARSLYFVGNDYGSMGDHQKALDYHKKAVEMALQLPDTNLAANCYNQISDEYRYFADYPSALEYSLKALSLFDKLHNEDGVANAHGAMGAIYEKLGQHSKALEHYNVALGLYEKQKTVFNMAVVYMRIGVIYDDLNDFSRSLENYAQALKIFTKVNSINGKAATLSNIGIVYCDKLKDYGRAIDIFKEAQRIFIELNDKYNEAGMDIYLATICVKAPADTLKTHGIAPSSRYLIAKKYAERAKIIGIEINDISTICNVWGVLSDVYEKVGDYKNAFLAYKETIRYKDSINIDTKKLEVQQKQMQYDFDKKEAISKAENDKKQALASAEISHQKSVRNTILGGSVLLLLAGGASFSLYRRKRDADQATQDAELRAQVTDTELKALRAQMNPHFIFNSLNSISDYISKNDIQAADQYLTRFARLMRMILENSEEKEVPLAEDLQALEYYMQLEARRLDNKFAYNIHISPDINADTVMIPPMILQPFVENSIWHGLSRKTDGSGKIDINISKEAGMLCCVVEDNGVGRNAAANNLSGKTSMGMKITQSRIDLINQRKKTTARISLSDLSQGTRATIILPLSDSF